MSVNEGSLREEIAKIRESTSRKDYTKEEKEKIRQEAARIFERYESDQKKKLIEQEQLLQRHHF